MQDDASAPAGLARRLAAIAYDMLALFALYFFFTLGLMAMTDGTAIPPGNPRYAALLVGIAGLFFCWFWTHGGQTLGMSSWRVRVVSVGGGRVGWVQALVRFGAALLSWACLGAGYWSALLDGERRTWHDRISDTRLVRV